MARMSLDQLRAHRPVVDQAKIDATTEDDIRRHMIEDGQDPDAEPTNYRLVPPVTAIRGQLRMTQNEFADAIGVPVATVRNWEQGRKVPDPAAVTLLRIVHLEPEAVMRALKIRQDRAAAPAGEMVSTGRGWRVLKGRQRVVAESLAEADIIKRVLTRKGLVKKAAASGRKRNPSSPAEGKPAGASPVKRPGRTGGEAGKPRG